MALHDLSSRLGVGIRPRLRRIWKTLDRMLFLRFWFPQVPLFLAAAIFGILEFSPVAARLLGLNPEDLRTALQDILDAGVLHTPQAAAGVLLLVMSVGLLMRSRLAWTISLLLTSVSLALFLIGKDEPAYWVLVVYNVVLVVALLLGYRYFRRSSLAAASLFAFISVASVLSYAVFGTYMMGAQFSPKITDIITALYFSMVTMSTVGYGDIHPDTPAAMLFVVSIIVLGITVFATSLSTLLMPLINRRMETLLRMREGNGMERANHYIIIGRTALAQNSYRELTSRNQKVTFILEKQPEEKLDGMDVVIGDPCAVETLEKAGVTRAHAVLALGEEDSDNAFVVLAVKDMAGDVKTVTVANDAGNLARMKRVHPDLIIAPQILGGELLAMALTGEQVDSDKLMKELLHLGG
ncbi:MAG: voltage-gated potassium channel protein [Rhizobiaceae bacterium]|nr:MAG: voltage-gated potassium channel protein [Rhizobiaceae bacterium]